MLDDDICWVDLGIAAAVSDSVSVHMLLYTVLYSFRRNLTENLNC